ncbi:MAG: DUF3301 domain-containing protein [Colwellia sp.]|uniref:DUF3301 domain-containing protein n=1 Tax=Colwellia sp. TaxID=56799 RepID=UPI001D531B24|nr:DUF3301 domain-containing protein [Colwellia sp.]MCJ8296053.1 DUF3301 domain-containing protein [Colwellia sp.]NQY49841.1 DUF3301 domain-containing protein [Colwellia sp.]
MENIYYLLVFCLFCWYFVYLRQVSEAAKKHVNRYCKEAGLQFISLARRSSRIKFTKQHGPFIYSTFDFDFSGDGESNNHGVLTLYGLKLEQINLPAYRVN